MFFEQKTTAQPIPTTQNLSFPQRFHVGAKNEHTHTNTQHPHRTFPAANGRKNRKFPRKFARDQATDANRFRANFTLSMRVIHNCHLSVSGAAPRDRNAFRPKTRLRSKFEQKWLFLLRRVRNWAEKLGGELWHLGELVTRRNMVIDVSYSAAAKERFCFKETHF